MNATSYMFRNQFITENGAIEVRYEMKQLTRHTTEFKGKAMKGKLSTFSYR